MEKYSKEGKLNRIAAEKITRGAICVLNSENKIALASASSTGLLLVANWDVEAGDTLSADIVGASAGTHVCTLTAATYAVGDKLALAAGGKLAKVTSSETVVGYFLGEAGTTTGDTAQEVALIA